MTFFVLISILLVFEISASERKATCTSTEGCKKQQFRSLACCKTSGGSPAVFTHGLAHLFSGLLTR